MSSIADEVIDLTPRSARTGRVLSRERALDEHLFDAAVQVTRTNVIAVVSPQGGAGKTRITFALGSALAQLSGLNVIAVDLDDDYGALSNLVPERTRQTRSFESLAEGGAMIPFPQLRACLSLTRSRMLVLRGPEETTDLDVMLSRLGNADVVIMDCAAGLGERHPRAAWAISRADQVLVVARPDINEEAGIKTGRALEDTKAIGCLVINQEMSRDDTRPAEVFFSLVSALQDTMHVPKSRRLARSMYHSNYRLEKLERTTRIAVKHLASTVGDHLR